MKTLDQIEPRTPISALPFLIRAPGAYYVTTNLTGTAGAHGIVIEVSHVSLDLNGFVLTGLTNSLNGVHVSNQVANVVIRGGTIRQWALGIDGRSGSNGEFGALRLFDNGQYGLVAGVASTVEHCTAQANGGVGIGVGESGIIRDCASRANGQHGMVGEIGSRIERCTASYNRGNGIVGSDECAISDCAAANNGASGVSMGAGGHIQGSKASNNGLNGILAAAGAMIRGCSAAGNLQTGILAGSGAHVLECRVSVNGRGIAVQSGSTVQSCVALQNSGDGVMGTDECILVGNTASGNFLARDAAGIHVSGRDNAIRENTVVSNDWGIWVEAAGNLIIKNSAANNSLNYLISGTPQAMGPIVSGDRFTDATNPTANFEF
jgi:parallel beta-helix repeat protein